MATTEINLNDPRVKRTRQLINDAFGKLLQEKGFEAITVQDIADLATVNRATFYAHYEDKFDLLESSVRTRFHDDLTAKLPGRPPLTEETLRKLAAAVFEHLAQVYGHCRLDRQFEPMVEGAGRETLQAFVHEWLTSQPRGAGSAGAATTALVISSTLMGIGAQWARGDQKQPVDELARQVAGVLMRGVTVAR